MFQRKVYPLTATAGFTASSGQTTAVQPSAREQDTGLVQVKVGTAATVQVQMSLDPATLGWVNVGAALTANGYVAVPGAVAYRLDVSGNNNTVDGRLFI